MKKDKPIPRPLARKVYDTAMRLHEMALWEVWDDTSVCAVRSEGADDPVLVQVLGAAGREYGLACYDGPHALKAARLIQKDQVDFGDEVDCKLVSITVSAVRAIPEPLRDLIEASGRSAPLGPAVLVKPAGRLARPARNSELKRYLRLLETIEAADRGGKLELLPLIRTGRQRVPVFTLRGTGPRASVEVSMESLDETGPAGLFDWPSEVRALPALDAVWRIGRRSVPSRILDEEREVQALLVYDAEQDQILTSEVLLGGELQLAVETVWSLMLEGGRSSEPGRPARIVCNDTELAEALQVGLAEAGVELDTSAGDDPAFEQVVAGLREHFHQLAEQDRGAAPGMLGELVLEAAEALHRALPRRLARKSAFGPDAWQLCIAGPPGLADPQLRVSMAHCALLDGIRDFEPLRNHGLDKVPTPLHRALIEILAATPLSLYEFEIGDGGVIAFRDLDRGTDQPPVVMARVDDPSDAPFESGTLVSGRLVEFEGRQEFVPLGSEITPSQIEEAQEILAADDLSLSVGSLREHPWQFVALGDQLSYSAAYDDLDEAGGLDDDPVAFGGGPSLTNTDGDPLAPQTATFQVGDEAALRRHLAERDDVHLADDPSPTTDDPARGSEWIWFRPSTGDSRTLLGRLQLVGDQLLVEVNSDLRLARLQLSFQTVPELQLLSTRTADPEIRPDDRLTTPPDLSSDELAQIRTVIEQKILAWVDESVPALNGLTPREAVKDPALRPVVESLIRTMPDPAGELGVKAPREELLRRLGLEG